MGRWVDVRNRTQDSARAHGPLVRLLRLPPARADVPAQPAAGRGPAAGGIHQRVRAQTAIHMAMVFMSLGVVWLDEALRVVDVRLVRPWGIYAPTAPARYVLEGGPGVLECVARGDQLELLDPRLD